MRTKHDSDEEWLSATELGKWLGIGRSKIYALLREEIPAHRIGKSTVRVRRDDIEAWRQSKQQLQRVNSRLLLITRTFVSHGYFMQDIGSTIVAVGDVALKLSQAMLRRSRGHCLLFLYAGA